MKVCSVVTSLATSDFGDDLDEELFDKPANEARERERENTNGISNSMVFERVLWLDHSENDNGLIIALGYHQPSYTFCIKMVKIIVLI